MTQGGILQNACAIHAPSRPAPGRRGVRNSYHVSQRNAYRWNGPAAIAGGSAISASPDGKEPVLKPPSTVTGVPPAGDGVDTKGSRSESAAQQGSSPEDATAEAARGSKTDSLADASGKAARSVRAPTCIFANTKLFCNYSWCIPWCQIPFAVMQPLHRYDRYDQQLNSTFTSLRTFATQSACHVTVGHAFCICHSCIW
jgi:hypothetical protein